jgi:muramoyltetrapeptide carboxypeptidase
MMVPAIIPAALRDGDVIGVCAPAGRPPAARLRRGLDRLAERFTIKLGPVAAAALRDEPAPEPPFLAADDRARADEFNALLADRDVRAIIMARGGYGAMRILPALDPAPLVADPKPLIGFSDITAILAWAATAGVRGIHGPVVTQLGELPAEDVAWLYRVLTDRAPLGPLPWALTGAQPGAATVRGPLIVGNLMLLTRLIGTPWQVDTTGAVIVLEEVHEVPYAIDRELTQLGLAGALDRVAAAVVGDFVRCTDPPYVAGMIDDPAAAIASVSERLARWRVPALFGAPLGHGARNRALPYGAAAVVDLSSGTLEVSDPAVA